MPMTLPQFLLLTGVYAAMLTLWKAILRRLRLSPKKKRLLERVLEAVIAFAVGLGGSLLLRRLAP